MSTYNHTPIPTGAAANASTFNSPLGELDDNLVRVERLISNRSTNRMVTLDGSDLVIETDDCFIQVNSVLAETDIILPDISAEILGRQIILCIPSTPGFPIHLVPGLGNYIVGVNTFSSEGIYNYRALVFYPGYFGNCWLQLD